ncbi:MAG: hypothetical protein WAM85_01840, partial [Terracidiphilus sp.]
LCTAFETNAPRQIIVIVLAMTSLALSKFRRKARENKRLATGVTEPLRMWAFLKDDPGTFLNASTTRSGITPTTGHQGSVAPLNQTFANSASLEI